MKAMYERTYGADYQKDMPLKDITKEIRKALKAEFPDFKFSVRKRGYDAVWIEVAQVPEGFQMIDDLLDANGNPMEAKPYKDMIAKVCEIANRWNYNGSEIEVDYFDVNYYCLVQLGDDAYKRYYQQRDAVMVAA